MKIVTKALLPAALLLSGCGTLQVGIPPQPSPSSIESTITALASISADPVTAWQAGNYSVRAACDAYLNQEAQRSAELNLAGTGIGVGGVAAAGMLASRGNLVASAMAGAVSGLASTFLSAYEASGALPYSSETTSLIQNAEDAYSGAVAPPQSLAEAANDTEGAWWICTPAGYAMLASKAIGTAQVSAGPSMTAAFAASPTSDGRPKIEVNGR